MASRIIEFFGYAPADQSEQAVSARSERRCPFLGATCTKTLSDGEISGVCTLKPATSGPVICCPIRLYAEDYKILKDVAQNAFGDNCVLFSGEEARRASVGEGLIRVAVFGKRWGKELRLPNRSKGKGKAKTGAYFVDWVLAKLDSEGNLDEFVAVEVQSIDTTGNYRKEREAYLKGRDFSESSTAGLNWENVNKRILPQIIYKGHAIRLEAQCRKGLFFVSPTPVFNKIQERLGEDLPEYPPDRGTITFMWYDVGSEVAQGELRKLEQVGQLTSTADKVALAFTAPSNLPPANSYATAIKAVLGQ